MLLLNLYKLLHFIYLSYLVIWLMIPLIYLVFYKFYLTCYFSPFCLYSILFNLLLISLLTLLLLLTFCLEHLLVSIMFPLIAYPITILPVWSYLQYWHLGLCFKPPLFTDLGYRGGLLGGYQTRIPLKHLETQKSYNTAFYFLGSLCQVPFHVSVKNIRLMRCFEI